MTAGGPSGRPLPEALRRRLDEVFGDVLPSTTSDERDPAERDPAGSDVARAEQELLADRPPHHEQER